MPKVWLYDYVVMATTLLDSSIVDGKGMNQMFSIPMQKKLINTIMPQLEIKQGEDWWEHVGKLIRYSTFEIKMIMRSFLAIVKHYRYAIDRLFSLNPSIVYIILHGAPTVEGIANIEIDGETVEKWLIRHVFSQEGDMYDSILKVDGQIRAVCNKIDRAFTDPLNAQVAPLGKTLSQILSDKGIDQSRQESIAGTISSAYKTLG
jgi:hypothetical protein